MPTGSVRRMMVSHERRVLFVHVQKTGGSTIDRMLEEAIPDVAYLQGLRGGRHARLAPALKAHPELKEYFKAVRVAQEHVASTYLVGMLG